MEQKYPVMTEEFADALMDHLACLFIFALGGPDEEKKDLQLALAQEYATQTFEELTKDLSDIMEKPWRVIPKEE